MTSAEYMIAVWELCKENYLFMSALLGYLTLVICCLITFFDLSL